MKDYTIYLERGLHQTDIQSFLKKLSLAPKGVTVEVVLLTSNFPNGLMTLTVCSRLLHRKLSGQGDFRFNLENVPIENKSLVEHVIQNINDSRNIIDFRDNRILKFNSHEEIYQIGEELGEHILKQPNNLNSVGFFTLKWAINEVLDNVINHSNSIHGGLFISHYSPKDGKIRIGITDFGIGILNSLQSGTLLEKPKSDEEALKMCIEKGVTCDERKGQGNGLFGLFSIVTENNGNLTISSGRKSLVLRNQEIYVSNNWVINEDYPTTTVYFEFDLNAKLNIQSVFPKTYTEKPIDFSISQLEVFEGQIRINVKEKSPYGFGTRKSGAQMYNYIKKMIEFEHKVIELDFNGVSIISSSWSDEFLGKLFILLGPITFGQLIRPINLNEVLIPIMEHSIIQRIKVGLPED